MDDVRQGGPMTGRWLSHWQPLDSPFPAHVEHASEDEATLHALRVSRELGVEVAVVRVEEGLS